MFVHLHVHSHFSMLESSIKPEDLIERACELGFKSIALTDKYVMHGAVQFYRLARSAGIKPVTGCEICLSENNCLTHLTILVSNLEGYRNICRLIYTSYINQAGSEKNSDSPGCSGIHTGSSIPFVKMTDLENFSGGLICLSGCSVGLLPALIRKKDFDGAAKFTRHLYNIFGDNFYIEVQRLRPADYSPAAGAARNFEKFFPAAPVSEMLINFARSMKVPIAATNDVHYLARTDHRVYRHLARIKLMSVNPDPTMKVIEDDQHYLKSAREMAGLFYDIPDAVRNTCKIAEKCCFDFDTDSVKLPHYKTPGGQSQDEYLKELCLKGLELRFGKNADKKISERLERELGVIKKTGFAGYFLVVADIAGFASENKIPVCGKGSAAGSLASYVLQISDVDPVANNLYFERFLNEERKEPPDIDIDISSRDREKIWNYLQSKYGRENVARVASFSTTKPRASLREAARLVNASKEEADHAVKLLSFSRKSGRYPAGTGSAGSSPVEYGRMRTIAEGINGYVRHMSVHPSAFIVSNSRLPETIPLAFSETGEVMSQFDMNSIEDIGILKIDLISSLSLSLIADVLLLLRKKRNINADISVSACNDNEVFRLMQEGKTLGVFQLESFGIRTLARKLKPASLNDITLLISLYRPGPQQSGMVDNFIERKFGREKTSCIHKDLEPVLGETYGVMLYQEQAMQVAIKVAGYSFGEADELRKAIVNLSKEKMFACRSGFIRRGIANGYERKTVEQVFTLISKFASYAFVKAHAAAYAELSYKTCYLKYHYPAEFIAAILTNNSGYYSKMQYIEEARRLGIKLKLPDINESIFNFEPEDSGTAIRVPLVSVKNLGNSSACSIEKERRNNGRFLNLADFCARMASPEHRINGSAIENLIKTGAFDFTSKSRKDLLFEFCLLKNRKKNSPAESKIHGPGLYESVLPEKEQTGNGSDTDNSLLAESFIADFTPWEKLELEAEILGFYVSENPISRLKKNLCTSGLMPYYITQSGSFYKRCSVRPGGYFFQCPEDLFTAGLVITKRTEKTKTGQDMMFCTLEDEDGMYETVLFPEAYKKYSKTIAGNSFLIMKGRLCTRDNNVSLAVRDVYSIAALKDIVQLRQKEKTKKAVLSENLKFLKVES